MKTVVYKDFFGDFCMTSEENYNARIRNARKIQKLSGFQSAEQVIDYCCKYCGKNPSDFIVVN